MTTVNNSALYLEEEKTFQHNTDLRGHLGYASLAALARNPWRIALIDRTVGRKPFRACILLAVGLLLSRDWRRSIKGKRVGIVLPPGAAATIVNLAVLWSGKVVVNLNPMLDPIAFVSCLQKGSIDTIVTASKVREKFPHLPWSKDTRDVAQMIQSFGSSKRLWTLLMSCLLPAKWIAWLFNIPQKGDKAEAALLFTSGSVGEPKAVVLTHRNLLANTAQVKASRVLPRGNILLACLPIFHSFGFTVTLWYATISQLKIVTLPSPLEYKRVGKVIYEEKVTVLIGTPTFYRAYLKHIKPESLKSLRCVIAGAEKTPPEVTETWEQQLGSHYLEGYGLTETAPVVSVNLADTITKTQSAQKMMRRKGSVGRLLPGIAARIIDSETLQPLAPTEKGLLCLRGANVFSGYLNQPKETQECFNDGWFVTGDLARFDADGFLFIEGRLSRFSKIGGEMIPHGTVETYIIEIFNMIDTEAPPVAVCGVSDAKKGEQLVLLTTFEIDAITLQQKMRARGVNNLWIPKVIEKVDTIPLLPTGKLNLRALQAMAEEVVLVNAESSPHNRDKEAS